MASTKQQPGKVVHHDKPVKDVHHGRTGAAWTGTIVGMAAFLIGGIAVIIQNWTLFTVAAILLVAGLIAAKVMQVLGYGAD